jgi:hypothetical protein
MRAIRVFYRPGVFTCDRGSLQENRYRRPGDQEIRRSSDRNSPDLLDLLFEFCDLGLETLDRRVY